MLLSFKSSASPAAVSGGSHDDLGLTGLAIREEKKKGVAATEGERETRGRGKDKKKGPHHVVDVRGILNSAIGGVNAAVDNVYQVENNVMQCNSVMLGCYVISNRSNVM